MRHCTFAGQILYYSGMQQTFKLCLIVLFCLSNQMARSTELPRRQGTVRKTITEIKIDGIADEPAWSGAEVYSDFTQYEPSNGKRAAFQSLVRMIYDNEGIYVHADLIDASPDSISTGLGKRDSDNAINADWFSIDLCPFDDGVNGFSFKLTVTGVQTDIKRASGSAGRDEKWDAIWKSATKITDEGWSAEIFIPFSAIRFPISGDKPWGINFNRFVARKNEISSWNFLDKTMGPTISQTGRITGFGEITPPVRLSLMPYISSFIEKQSDNQGGIAKNISGGIDLKWGLNESFTLDVTLVPDFSQLQSDDQVLNLTPYEIQYNERRQFFTEGTDVFSKGDIFYSRRIGAKPRGYNNAVKRAGDTLDVYFNPTEAGLINATKISGRTSGGLGIGFLNAMTGKALALLEDPRTGEKQEYLTEAFTNYNLVVVDQSFKNSSYVSLINSNVMRHATHTGLNYNANVTAAEMQFYTGDHMFFFKTVGALSQKFYSDQETIRGHNIFLSGGKSGGRFTAKYTNKTYSNNYDPNDLGYLKRNNLISNALSFGYNSYTSSGKLYAFKNSLDFVYDMLYMPRAYNTFIIDLSSSLTFKNFLTLTFTGSILPAGSDDYFEPRVTGRMYHWNPFLKLGGTFNTDPKRTLLVKGKMMIANYYTEPGRLSYDISINPTFRLSDRFSTVLNVETIYDINDEGFAGLDNGRIIFGRRRNSALSGELGLSYIFTAKSYVTFRLREYWAQTIYDGRYGILQTDGSVTSANMTRNDDTNYNAFNIDLDYTWIFAPGSELTLVWKETIYDSGNYIPVSLSDNIRNLFRQNLINVISLKLIYYIDYHTLARKVIS